MGEFSILWALVIVGITYVIYKAILPCINGKKNKIIWIVAIISTCVYSGIGIAYSTVSKGYIWQYVVYVFVLGVSLACFTRCDLVSERGHMFIQKRPEKLSLTSKESLFWNAKWVANVFVVIFVIYFLLRCGSLVYPENKLTSFTITYNVVNNLKNINGENVNILNSMASYIKPMAYIGFVYAFKKVRYVAALLCLDLVITLVYAGYISRNLIICVLFIVLMLFFNNDLSSTYISMGRKKKRIIIVLAVATPVVLYMMIYLMSIRTSNQSEWTILSFLSSEINYPMHYAYIDEVSGTLMTSKDMILHILDSFVPFVPTPGYISNINVLFSEQISGVSSNTSWFSVILPGILGEAKLIFGNHLFWIHAVIVAFMMSMITRITKDNPKMIILYYYYLTCVMKASRAGYAELSSTVMFNIIILVICIGILRMIDSTIMIQKTKNNKRSVRVYSSIE